MRTRRGQQDDESKKGKLIRKRTALIEQINKIVDSVEGAVVPPTINDSKIRVASDCTGLGSEVIALTLAGLHSQVEGKFWSDNDPSKRTLFRIVCSELGHDAGHCDTDISERILLDDTGGTVSSQYLGCDVYVAGYPCPSFSSAGKRRGQLDVRGLVGLHGLELVARAKPCCCILENVRGLLNKKHSAFTDMIRDVFRKLKYVVYKRVLNTASFGVPQNRHRVYIVAIRKDCLKKKFHWPKEMKLSKNSLKRHLDIKASGGGTTAGHTPPDLRTYEEKYGKKNIWQGNYVLDVGSSAGWQSAKEGVCPCLTRTRLGSNPPGYFIPQLNRILSTEEAAALQGFPVALVKPLVQATSEQIVRKALGDSMSINVLSKVMLACLRAIGKIESVGHHDAWTQEAVASKKTFAGGTGDDAFSRYRTSKRKMT